MKRCLRPLRWVWIFLSLMTALAACGHGGTEVGNPNPPGGVQAPSTEPMGPEGDPDFASPSPTPDESLITTPEEEAPE